MTTSTILRRSLVAAPRHARPLSILDNLRKIISRAPPPSPLPSKPTDSSSSSSDSATSSSSDGASLERVGVKPRKSKIIGFKLDVPTRLYGADLSRSLDDCFVSVLGDSDATIGENDKLVLVQTIHAKTGRRVPDYVLNRATRKKDIEKWFDAEDRREKTERVLTFDQAKLPDNVKIL